MRPYPRNSPQAACRIVALTLLADGNLCRREIAMLERLEAPLQLGLSMTEVHAVVHAFCEDLLSTAGLNWTQVCTVQMPTLESLLAEVDDPVLQRRVLGLCFAIVEADGHLADAEANVLEVILARWGLHRDLFDAAMSR